MKYKPDLLAAVSGQFSFAGEIQAQPLKEDLAARWVVNTAEQVEQGGFPPTAGPEYDNEVATLNSQVDSPQSFYILPPQSECFT